MIVWCAAERVADLGAARPVGRFIKAVVARTTQTASFKGALHHSPVSGTGMLEGSGPKKNVLEPTTANVIDIAVRARDMFKGGQSPTILYVFFHNMLVGSGTKVRMVLDLYRDEALGRRHGWFLLHELAKIPGGSARDYRDKIAGALSDCGGSGR